MLSSLIVGSITKIAGDFFETRKKKKEAEIQQDTEDRKAERQFELIKIENELQIEIEKEKTNQEDLKAIQKKIDANKEIIKEINKTDRLLYKNVSPWILNWVAIMKPFISTIAVLSYCSIIFIFLFKKTDANLLQTLDNLNVIGTLESIIGFWFGFGSMEAMSRVKNK